MAFGMKVTEYQEVVLRQSIDPTFAFKVNKKDKSEILFNTKVELEEAQDYLKKHKAW